MPDVKEDQEEMTWLRVCTWLQHVLAVLGAFVLVLAIGGFTGYWWARSGEPKWIQAAQPADQTPCGSCKKGDGK